MCKNRVNEIKKNANKLFINESKITIKNSSKLRKRFV